MRSGSKKNKILPYVNKILQVLTKTTQALRIHRKGDLNE